MAQTMRCSTLLDLFCPVRQSPSGGGISALSRAARPPPARVPHAKTNTVLRCLSPNLTSLYGGKVWKGAASPHFHLNNPAAADAFCGAKCAGRAMGPTSPQGLRSPTSTSRRRRLLGCRSRSPPQPLWPSQNLWQSALGAWRPCSFSLTPARGYRAHE
jgi:hypothetical protein